jgi:hypothetical protein
LRTAGVEENIERSSAGCIRVRRGAPSQLISR